MKAIPGMMGMALEIMTDQNIKPKTSIMTKIAHRFRNHVIDSDTETLIIGTFNPEMESNDAEFFYGRGRNYLWRLLPSFYEGTDLKEADTLTKKQFIKKHKIDFVDLIDEVKIEGENMPNLIDDKVIDKCVTSWKDIPKEIERLKNLKRVCLTRKSFSGIPNIKMKINEIQRFCESQEIPFQFLVTPARFHNEKKQEEWNNFLGHGPR